MVILVSTIVEWKTPDVERSAALVISIVYFIARQVQQVEWQKWMRSSSYRVVHYDHASGHMYKKKLFLGCP